MENRPSVILIALLLTLVGCRGEPHGDSAAAQIEQVLERHNERLLSIPDVTGTAIGERDGRPCILVFVVKKTPELMKKIPSTLEGFQVVVEETGTIRPLSFTDRPPRRLP
ncbi:MAG TPA: hypothetical protein VNO43_03410 [Candidatus Eisenbacteria bacterium]|nr:hypothetical protein [Candidatus Eisenbacteria bacterium]